LFKHVAATAKICIFHTNHFGTRLPVITVMSAKIMIWWGNFPYNLTTKRWPFTKRTYMYCQRPILPVLACFCSVPKMF
jgi:hypothetical protein